MFFRYKTFDFANNVIGYLLKNLVKLINFSAFI